MDVKIHGFCDERFAPLRDAFIANFEAGDELGASLALTHQGKIAVDLWAGYADDARTQPWRENTIVPVASTAKVSATASLLLAIDRGLIEMGAPVARYWPEFAQGGKAAVTVHDVLTHQAGVPGLYPPPRFEDWRDWDAIAARIAAEPHWFAGERRVAYHSATFGMLASELVRRVDGRKPRQFFHEEFAARAGIDFQIGLSAQSEMGRAAHVRGAPSAFGEDLPGRIMNSFTPAGHGNTWLLLSSEIPGASGVTNARAIAKLCAIFAMGGEWEGVRYLSKSIVEQAGAEQAIGKCPVMGGIRWGLGLALDSPDFRYPSPTTYGWGGHGGSWAIMDPRTGTSLGYAPNNFKAMQAEPRLPRIGRALHKVLLTL